MYGWTGKILRVNLTNHSVSVEDLDAKLARDFIGSRGLGAKFLYDEVEPKVDPLSPENKLIFATGPLTGTLAPGGSRYTVITKSPLTGAIANSNAGGHFPAELKFAGFDLIIFEGKAKKPVYLWIENEKVEIRDATKLWGKSVPETEDLIRAETDEFAKVACIGPAGENLVRFANIINDKGNAAGRSGVGAVMGSKNLKAVAVRGTKGVTVADKEGFRKAVLEVHKFLDNPSTHGFSALGTPLVTVLTQARGVLPTKNFQTGVFEGAEKVYGEVFTDTINVRGRMGMACFSCPVACHRYSRVVDSEFKGEGPGPEYETIGAFGPGCGVDNPSAIAKANMICNEMGMDTITCGFTIACAMELYEKGFLPQKDTGVALNFGNAKAMVDLVGKTALREGFGDLLAEGSYRLAEKYGHPELSMSVKKQEFACYDTRGLQGMAIEYATMNRGACHIRGEVQDIDLFGVYTWKVCTDKNLTFVDSLTTEDKPLLTKEVQDWFTSFDSSGMCNFIFFLGINEDGLLALLDAGTGAQYRNVAEMLKCGERAFNVERLFNLKAGFTAKDDTLPKRMLEEPMPSGPVKGQVALLDKMLPEYYRLRGWDHQGIPTQGKLKDLGLV